MGKSKVVKVTYYKHDMSDIRTSYKVFVWNGDCDPPPRSAREYTGVWESLFGINGGKEIPFFKCDFQEMYGAMEKSL